MLGAGETADHHRTGCNPFSYTVRMLTRMFLDGNQFRSISSGHSAVGNADAEIRVLCAEYPVLSKVLSLKPGICQEKVFRAPPTARNSLFLIFAFAGHSSIFLPPVFL